MSFAATLTLNGMKRQLLTLDKHYFHTTIAAYQRCYDNNVYYTLKDLYQASLYDSGNYTMPPKGQPYGGILRMTMESHEDDEDLFYLFKEGRFFDGSIEIYGNGEEDQIMQHIEYWDAWISDIGEHMCSTGSNPMILSMEISPATTRFNKKLLFQKSWFMTDIKQKEASDRMMGASMVGEMKIASTSASIGSVVKKNNIVENSADVSFNTFTVDKKTEAIVGDMIILSAPYGHIAIYSKIKGRRKLSYGNLATEDGNTIVPPITTKNDWSDSTSGGLKYNPDTQKAHRWNVLKF